MKRACVIGAGFGGLALAVRLQSAGIATTLIEGREKVGGRAYVWEREGFTFDAGPTVVTDPDCLRELWALSGHDIADDVTLMPVFPFYRLNWTDGTTFDYSNDEGALRREIARVAPDDLAGYEEFERYSAGVWQEGYVKLGHEAFLDFSSMIKAAPALARYQAWRSVYSMVSHFVKDERLRQALSFHTLLVGGNPMSTSAIYALIHKLEKDGGVWWTKGGTNRLAQGMAALFQRLGGTLRTGDKAVRIHTVGDQVSEVECASGWRERFDAVASNGDLMHTYSQLLGETIRGKQMAARLARKRFSPSLFVVHFGVEGTWPGIPHHTILFGPRYQGLLDDIFENGVLPRDFSIYLHHPTVTDPSMAPAGKSTFYALVPVAHMGKLPIDWAEVGPVLERRVLAEVGRRLIPDIEDRIVTRFHYAPPDFEADLGAWKGNAFSLEPLLTQSAFFRGHNRDDKLKNLYLVGAGTHPGAGIPGVVGSAKATAKLMLDDLR
ncbi:phytoene desaturase [Novosphingobium soli]|uniref:Phytoene dehydrogenase n=1 Tax=Novosphingobium soli TaxID=574956 RepID=A0ABV6CZX2_9SPHN